MTTLPPEDEESTETSSVDGALLAELTRAALPFLGPYSITTVKRASRTTADVHALIRSVAEQITNPVQHAQFVKMAYRALKEFNAPTSGNTTTVKVIVGGEANPRPNRPRKPTPITPDYVYRGQDALAQILGPLASVLSQRYAHSCDNSRDFFDKLATHLRSQEERDIFFERVRSAGGMVAAERKP